jgi:putative glutamine amidotransferase
MKPLIGITMNLEVQPARSRNLLDQDYGKAVHQAGGIPVPILGIENSISDLVKQLDGFVFSGGDDIHPRFYREKPLAGAGMTISPDNRTRFEQLVNVALGGALYQDISLQVPKPIKHGAKQRGEKVFHEVDIVEGTRLSRILGASRVRVRSSHHQSVKSPGRGLRLSAQSRDGVVEALEPERNNFLIAVQWHPEKTPNDRHSKRLFKAFVNASKK